MLFLGVFRYCVMNSSSDEEDGIAHIPPLGSAGLRIVLQDISQQLFRTDSPAVHIIQDVGNVEGLPTLDVGDAEENVTDQVLGLRTRNRIALANNIQASSDSGAVAMVGENNDVILIDDTQPQEAHRNSTGATPSSSRKRRRYVFCSKICQHHKYAVYFQNCKQNTNSPKNCKNEGKYYDRGR